MLDTTLLQGLYYLAFIQQYLETVIDNNSNSARLYKFSMIWLVESKLRIFEFALNQSNHAKFV